jgi:hypothetical protein
MITEKNSGEKYASKVKQEKKESKVTSGKGAKALLFGVARKSVKAK